MKLRPIYIAVSSDGDYTIWHTQREARAYRSQARKRWPEHEHAVVRYTPDTVEPFAARVVSPCASQSDKST